MNLNRLALIACFIGVAHAGAAHAQSAVYVGGDIFLDVQRGSGQTAPTRTSLDTTTGSGGVRVGTSLGSRWTIEAGVDATASADSTTSIGGDPLASSGALSAQFSNGSPTGIVTQFPTPILISFDQRVRTSVTSTAILLGYHPPPRGRFTAGFKGGINFLRSSRTLELTTIYTVTDPRLAALITLPAPSSTTLSSVTFSTAAEVGAELAIELTPHASVVPEIRAFGSGGRLFLRLGAELRWFF